MANVDSMVLSLVDFQPVIGIRLEVKKAGLPKNLKVHGKKKLRISARGHRKDTKIKQFNLQIKNRLWNMLHIICNTNYM